MKIANMQSLSSSAATCPNHKCARVPPVTDIQKTTKQSRPRQAISGMIVTIILIGIVVSIGGILSVTVTDIVSTGLVLDTVEVKQLNIQNTQAQSYLTGLIKNNGNSDLQDVRITIVDVVNSNYTNTDTDGYYPFSPAEIHPGESATIRVGLHDGSNVERLNVGQKYLIEIRADIVGGGEIAKTITVAPQ